MKKRTSSISFPLLVLLLLSALLFSSFPRVRPQEVEDEKEFSYIEGSPNGPENWGKIHEEWAACGRGKTQSPIDLILEEARLVPSLGRLKTCYSAANATLKNRGHDIMLQWDEDGGSIWINGTTYALKQCHWHSPSEHTVNGIRFALEAHLVHQSADRKIAVIGILYKIGRPDSFLKELEEYIHALGVIKEAEPSIDAGLVNPRHIKIRGRKYYRYDGSLTTPPCTEGVTWTIIKKVRTVSVEQVNLLKEAVHDDAVNNARPIRPTNGREVQFFAPKKRDSDLGVGNRI